MINVAVPSQGETSTLQRPLLGADSLRARLLPRALQLHVGDNQGHGFLDKDPHPEGLFDFKCTCVPIDARHVSDLPLGLVSHSGKGIKSNHTGLSVEDSPLTLLGGCCLHLPFPKQALKGSVPRHKAHLFM